MALTIQQVQENNVVAKKWLKEILSEIKTIRAAKLERKNLPLMTRVSTTYLQMQQIDNEVLRILEDLVFDIKMYFKAYYKYAALLSKYESPSLSFITKKDVLLWTMQKTYSLGICPHPIQALGMPNV